MTGVVGGDGNERGVLGGDKTPNLGQIPYLLDTRSPLLFSAVLAALAQTGKEECLSLSPYCLYFFVVFIFLAETTSILKRQERQKQLNACGCSKKQRARQIRRFSIDCQRIAQPASAIKNERLLQHQKQRRRTQQPLAGSIGSVKELWHSSRLNHPAGLKMRTILEGKTAMCNYKHHIALPEMQQSTWQAYHLYLLSFIKNLAVEMIALFNAENRHTR